MSTTGIVPIWVSSVGWWGGGWKDHPPSKSHNRKKITVWHKLPKYIFILLLPPPHASCGHIFVCLSLVGYQFRQPYTSSGRNPHERPRFPRSYRIIKSHGTHTWCRGITFDPLLLLNIEQKRVTEGKGTNQ